MNASQRDRAEHGPQNGPQEILKKLADSVKKEDCEGEAGVRHGYVESQAYLRVTGEGAGVVIGSCGGRRAGLRRRRVIGLGFSDGSGSEHLLPRWRESVRL